MQYYDYYDRESIQQATRERWPNFSTSSGIIMKYFADNLKLDLETSSPVDLAVVRVDFGVCTDTDMITDD